MQDMYGAVQPRKHVQRHARHTAPTGGHELDNMDQETISTEMSR